ncbi:MAG: phosphonoacetaldehyde hydrolase [Pirellulales bacterium]|nr:phosphonoacetaldehyde hydrolase [Pirellulales bacterium]
MYNPPRKLEAILLDWGGTTIDHGSRAPMQVFVEIFRQSGIEITEAEARGPMGKAKREHIAEVIHLPRIAALWREKTGRSPAETDIDRLYAQFLPLQKEILAQHSRLIPGVGPALAQLAAAGYKIGSTTGFTRELMDVLVPLATEQGYCPAAVICSDDVPAGRPLPWMNFRAAEKLGSFPPSAILAVDDTLVGIAAARNAGMWCVGVTICGNGLGLDYEQTQALGSAELDIIHQRLSAQYLAQGAHFAIRSVAELPEIIEQINSKLAALTMP